MGKGITTSNYYRPSNNYLYFLENDPLQKLLQKINSQPHRVVNIKNLIN